jgi:hypothetical protein
MMTLEREEGPDFIIHSLDDGHLYVRPNCGDCLGKFRRKAGAGKLRIGLL